MSDRPKEQWGSKLGVILAVAGSAVGLGNFLRFPGQAAKYGGGAFMIPYLIALLIVGIPIGWAEWTMGRRGGRLGFNSAPGIFGALWRRDFAKYIGALGLLIPVIIYMYYVYLESWCLGYAVNYALTAIGATQNLGLGSGLDLGKNPSAYRNFYGEFTGQDAHGDVFSGGAFGFRPIVLFFAITYVANFYLIYRGLSKGIEKFCKVAMPMLILCAFIVMGRVLTLPEQPVPKPWQVSLAQALPAEEWNKLRGAAVNPDSTPAQVSSELNSAFDSYYKALKTRADDAVKGGPAAKPAADSGAIAGQNAGYNFDIPVMPPVGFAASEDGLAIAMAELRAGSEGESYRAAIEKASTTFSSSTKVELQQLEREEIELLGEIAEVAGERKKAEEKAGDATKAFPALDRRESEFRTALDEARRRRSELLSEAGVSSALASQVAAVKRENPPSAEDAQLAVERAAALDASELPRSVWNGLGYMWNPDFDDLVKPEVWIAAAGQIFFSLSVGFGIVLCYASYLKPKDDVVLSSLTASSTNEFCEVVLGGHVAIPATFVFLGTASTIDIINKGSSFGLGFNALPAVFANMPAGNFFGAIWFFLLFLAGITSSLSMLQPAIAFLEEGFGLRRRASVAALGLLTIGGSLFVMYFSKDSLALDTMDFWVGSVAIFVLATIQVILFGWVIGVDEGFRDAHEGADLRIPNIFRFIIKYVTPTYLLVIFARWLVDTVPGYAEKILSDPPTLLTVVYMLIVFCFFGLMINLAGEQWRRQGRMGKEG